MVHHLYTNFLADKKIYNLAQGYWQRLFSSLSHQHQLHFVPYLNPETRIGQKEYDGNPIFNALEKKCNRAVRIIQAAPQGEHLDISAWLDSIALSEKVAPVPELVLDIVLSKESYAIAERLIRAWLVEGAVKEDMERLIGEEMVM
ncbi:MAG: hypothetical protein ACKV1O_00925 [Saprospiraceae bacterium]